MAKITTYEIDNTGAYEGNQNGGIDQTIIFTIGNDDNKFKIDIHSESYDFQSYARLFKWTDEKGFALITNHNPKKRYGLDLAYKPIKQNCYTGIIEALVKIAGKF